MKVSIRWGECFDGDIRAVTCSSGRVAVTPQRSVEPSVSILRLRRENQPASELFVAYTDQRDTTMRGVPILESRAFIVKVNRLFRF